MPRRPTGVVFDLKMLEHKCLWDSNYPENPERLSAVLERLVSLTLSLVFKSIFKTNKICSRCHKLGLIDRCVPLLPRYATEAEVLSVHTNEHIQKLKDVCKTNDVSKMEEFCSNYDAVFVHPTTYELALLSVGCTVDLVEAVLDEKIQNGMALIRPPGHHAMKSEYCGYCLFNNVAIAAKRVLDSGKASKVLIVDFDVHHGQATQQMFYDDKRYYFI
jgi:histone deacetylase 6